MTLTRKSFLRGSAAGLFGAAVPSVRAVEAVGRPQQNLSSKKMKFQGTPFKGRVTCSRKGPLADVIVSNGRDCVKTDRDGRYELPEYSEARFVFVTVPSGYSCEHWYHDCWQKLGSFDFHLKVCERTAKDKPCRFVHISDSEIHSAYGQAWVQDVKSLAEREDCAFIVHTGDICGRDGLIAHQKVMDDLTMGRKVVYAIGNHDCVSSFPWGEAEFEALYGPCWHSFDACGVHFLVTPILGGTDRPYGYTPAEVADWIRADLALVDPKTPVVVFNHYRCFFFNPAKSARVWNGERPVDFRTACNFKAYVHGHMHAHAFQWRDGVAIIAAANPNFGGSDHSPSSARVITVPMEGRVSARTFYGDFLPFKSERAGALWETKLDAGILFGGVTDGGDVLYCAVSDDDGAGTGAVCALEKSSGRIRWKSPVVNTIKGALALADGAVIGADIDGHVYAFEAKDGRERWRMNLSGAEENLLPLMEFGPTASPTGDAVVVGTAHRMVLLDVRTGKVRWRGKEVGSEAAMVNASAFAEGAVVSQFRWSLLVCRDAATGEVRWTKEGYGFPGGRPHVRDGKVVCVSGERIAELDLRTGEVIRSSKPVKDGDFSCPGDLVETADLYLKGTKNSGLVAIDRKTLKRAWTGTCGESLVGVAPYRCRGTKCIPTTPTVLPDGKTVCAGGADGAIHFWRLTDGKLLRSIKTGAPYLGPVVASGSVVYAADLAGFVRAFAV